MTVVLAIAGGGAVGSVLRHYVIAWGARFHDFFPYGTLTVNIVGSFLIGFLMEWMAQKVQASLEMRAFLVTGVLGGFTTFSAFSFDVFKLVETNHVAAAIVYAAASVALSLAAVFGGVFLMRGVFA